MKEESEGGKIWMGTRKNDCDMLSILIRYS